MSDRQRKTTFNSAASLYDEIRPEYPDDLIQDVLALSGIPKHGRILEIGCGTGKATKPFAALDYQIVCLDIGPDLIEVAKEYLKAYPNVSFEVCPFEQWDANQTFDLIISATAFHWIDLQFQFTKTRDILTRQGALAIFSHTHIKKNEGFFSEVQALYDKYYITSPSDKSSNKSSTPLPGLDAFHEPIRREYPWSQAYTSEQYIKLLGTYSDHIALPEHNQKLLYEGITNLIDKQYRGSVVKHYLSNLNLYKKKVF